MNARLAVARQEGLTEEEIAEIPNYESSELLSPREKAAIHFAEVLAGDHLREMALLNSRVFQLFGGLALIALGILALSQGKGTG